MMGMRAHPGLSAERGIPEREPVKRRAQFGRSAWAAVDHLLRDIGQLEVALLGEQPEHLERTHVVYAVSLHDALSLADSVSGLKRIFELSPMLVREDGSGSLRGEHTGGCLVFGAPHAGLKPEKVERRRGPTGGEQLTRFR
jgi:hypothetical protein